MPGAPDARQTFFVGIGAQKAGTSWLFNYLASHPSCRLSPMKELHYFDSFQQDELASAILRTEKNITKASERSLASKLLPFRRSHHGHTHRERLDFLHEYRALLYTGRMNEAAYGALLRRYSAGKPTFGEVTPAYAILSGENFARLHAAHPKTRMVFMMRDPLARLWSAARMKSRRKGNQTTEFAVDVVQQVLAGKMPKFVARADYRATIENLQTSVPPQDVHYEFFEDLFGDQSAAGKARLRICDFLGLQPHSAPRLDDKQNEGKPMPMPDSLAREATAFLRPQYRFVGDTFGRLPDAWRESLARYG